MLLYWTLFNIDFFADSSKFDEKSNLLKVNQFLQVEGYDNVYALGDCVNTPEHKMAAHAGTHANCIASNFIKELKGQEKSPYKQSKISFIT